jgi:hypothetical protein
MNRIPRTLRRYVVSSETIDRTRRFLADRGKSGFEATVLWLGRVIDETTAEILSPYEPEQVGYRSQDGVAVEVTAEGLSTLISELPDGVFVLCRVHTHPGDAYHSDLDDQNLIIAHPGAISIVVPDFARRPIELTGCSVNELGNDGRWRELSSYEVGERFEVTP